MNAVREKYFFRLYITGLSPNSVRALVNIKVICETYISNNYDLEIIDISTNPDRADLDGIIATPVLVKKSPLPEKKLIGDLSKIELILQSLDLN
jgi:circadian clock protein KaiB